MAVHRQLFRRHKKDIFTIYADEMQNLVSEQTDFDVLFSEARKFSVSIVTANQFGAQLPATMRSAIQAIGTRVFFQLSPEDAEQIARDIGGSKTMVERLKNLCELDAFRFGGRENTASTDS